MAAYPGHDAEQCAIRILARFSKARLDAMRQSCRTAKLRSEPVRGEIGPAEILCMAPGAVAFRTEGDINGLIASLRREQDIPRMDSEPRTFSIKQTGWRAELAEESELAALALRLCDSTRTVGQAVQAMGTAVGAWHDIPGQTVAVHTLIRLMERGLIQAQIP
jgi:hypothetical protein